MNMECHTVIQQTTGGSYQGYGAKPSKFWVSDSQRHTQDFVKGPKSNPPFRFPPRSTFPFRSYLSSFLPPFPCGLGQSPQWTEVRVFPAENFWNLMCDLMHHSGTFWRRIRGCLASTFVNNNLFSALRGPWQAAPPPKYFTADSFIPKYAVIESFRKF